MLNVYPRPSARPLSFSRCGYLWMWSEPILNVNLDFISNSVCCFYFLFQIFNTHSNVSHFHSFKNEHNNINNNNVIRNVKIDGKVWIRIANTIILNFLLFSVLVQNISKKKRSTKFQSSRFLYFFFTQSFLKKNFNNCFTLLCFERKKIASP